MFRDENLILAILKWREGVERSGAVPPPDLPDWTRDQICYHAELCQEEGWLQSYSHVMSGDGREPERLQCRIGALTAAGHRELKRLRGQTGG